MSIKNGQIFNVPEPTGAEQVQFETTAAEAERSAPNRAVAQEVEQNAEQAQGVAKQAALAAHSMGSEMTGQANVESAKAAGAGYLDQASTMASDVLASAQSYLPGQGQTGSDNQGTGIGSQLQSGAATALSTAKEYISTAQTAAQPHVENARSTLQPHIESVAAAAQPHIDRAKETVQSYIDGQTGVNGKSE